MDTSKFDAILMFEEDIMESLGDERSYAGSVPGGYGGTTHYNLNYDDPKLYASNAFGRLIQNEFNNWKQGYSAKVTDFAKWVVVDVTYHHHVTGRSASKTFLVVFNGGPKGTDKGGGLIMSTANKYRTISGYGQAVSYIKSVCSSLESVASQKL